MPAALIQPFTPPLRGALRAAFETQGLEGNYKFVAGGPLPAGMTYTRASPETDFGPLGIYTTQTLTGATNPYVIPIASLNRRYVKEIQAYKA